MPFEASEGRSPAVPPVAGGPRLWVRGWPPELWATFCLATLALVSLVLSRTPIPAQALLAAGWAVSIGAGVVAVISSVRLARMGPLHPVVRRFWWHLSVTVGLVTLGGAIQAVVGLRWDAARGPVPPSPGEVLVCLVGIVVLLRGLVLLPGARRTRAEWQTFGLDAATVLVGSSLVAWTVVMSVRDEGTVPTLVLPVVAVLAVAATGGLVALKLVAGGISRVDPRSLRTLALGALVGGALGGVSASLSAHRLPDASYVAIAWAMLFVVASTEMQRRNAVASHRSEPVRARMVVGRRGGAGRIFARLPYLAVGITDVLLLGATWRYRGATVIAAGAVVLTALVLVRQLVISREMAHVLGRLDGTVFALRDSQERLTFQASHDALTGLPNRTLLRGRIAESLQAAGGGSVAVALIDLDDFKVVNDRLGHDMGDELLVLTTARLTEALAGGDVVGRLGGDEFALVMSGVRADTMHERIGPVLEALAEPLVVSGNEIFVCASIGVACAVEGVSAEELLRQADVAMYVAKKREGSSWATYSAQMDSDAIAYARTATGLRQGLLNDEFLLCYQPIVTLPEGRIVGTEALLRWRDPETGRMVPPDQFIPIAERSGFIVPLGGWVLTQACRQAVAWRSELGEWAPDYVSVNISPRQLVEDGIVAEVAAALTDSGLPAGRLLLEVTETAVFGGGAALTALDGLRELGVRIALDDFGTGHSSLGLLLSCPVDVLKLDKSFVDDVTGPGRQAVIATFLAGVARGLDLQTVAEGVETAEQAQRLYELGYQNAQGYYFARPVPGAELTALITAAARGRRPDAALVT